MTREHMIWLETAKIQTKPIKPITIYNASYENKEVRIYSIDSEICINWYIDGRLIEKPRFPKEIITEIDLFFQTIYAKYIDKYLMCKILNKMRKYLPYLEDGDDEDTVRNIILNVEVSR